MKIPHKIFTMVLFCSLSLFADSHGETVATAMNIPPESVSVAVGEISELEAPFPIDRAVSSSDCVRVFNVEENKFKVEGKSTGKAIVSVYSGGLKKEFNIAITNSLLNTYRGLLSDLADIPEISVEMASDYVSLRGEIGKISDWEYFTEVLKNYPEKRRNYVRFRPSAELFDALKKQLKNAGYDIVKSASRDLPNSLEMEMANGVLLVNGFFLSPDDIESVRKVFSAQKWLSNEYSSGGLKLICDFKIVDIQIDVGVVVVGVTRSQLEKIGNAAADGTVVSWDLGAWFKTIAGGAFTDSRSNKGASASFNTNLKGALLFFANNGISDFRDAGHMSFINGSPNFAEYENGGTTNVKVYGSESADLKEIPYGFKYKIKGRFIRKDELRMDFELEKSLAPVKDDGDYTQRKTKVKNELNCKLGKTAVIAGQREVSYVGSGPQGYKYLREIPIINWFTSYEEEKAEELQLLVLVYPQIANTKVKLLSHPSEETKDAEKNISKELAEKISDVATEFGSPTKSCSSDVSEKQD